ncbi:zinc-dependent alcohol dehydrogenase [Silvibacterium acidisoli]|uniref:zinc-dependent alcohol dehydrogenase n=1 Tax=Acidobacteriaceae bacterium ZG23-2 TaxID=2883246 RepID=UPI00406C7151
MSDSTETMRAAQFLGPHQLEIRTVALPAISEGEALVAIEACGFCGSDLSIFAGTHPRARAPLTVGHELAGRIVQIKDAVTGLRVGDRVTVFPLITCGKCYACTHGHSHVCRQLRLFGIDADGGMAQFAKLPASALIPLPDDVSYEIGALIEPLAVVIHGISRVPFEDVQLAVVLGAGPIGLLTALVAKARGIPEVLVSDVLPHRRELAEQLGLRAVAAGEELRSLVMELSDNNGADVIYECAGHPSAALEVTELARSRGAIVNLSVFKKPVEIDMQAVNFKELEIFGSRVYERKDFEEALRLAPALPLAALITRTFPLDQAEAALQQFRAGEVCKAIIFPQQGPA